MPRRKHLKSHFNVFSLGQLKDDHRRPPPTLTFIFFLQFSLTFDEMRLYDNEHGHINDQTNISDGM